MKFPRRRYPGEEETVDLLERGLFLLEGSWRERRGDARGVGELHVGGVYDGEGEGGVEEETVVLGGGGGERGVEGEMEGGVEGGVG